MSVLVSSSSFIASPIPKYKHLFFYLLSVLPNPQSESSFTNEQHTATERSSSDQLTPQKGRQAFTPVPALPPPRAFSGDLEVCSTLPCRITDRCEARLTSKAPPLPTPPGASPISTCTKELIRQVGARTHYHQLSGVGSEMLLGLARSAASLA